MSKFAKWIAGGLGWAIGGPIGGIAGFVVGALYDEASSTDEKQKKGYSSRDKEERRETKAGDFGLSMIILSAAVMRADGKVMRSELDYVKNFFQRQFGDEQSKEMILILRKVLQQDIELREVCSQIRYNMPHPMRLQLLHYLFGIAFADNSTPDAELRMLQTISRFLGISSKDFMSIRGMFKITEHPSFAYDVLEIPKTATDEEVKRAYRRMAVKYHPDKVASLGTEIQQGAKEKFQKIQEAYEQIKKERKMA